MEVSAPSRFVCLVHLPTFHLSKYNLFSLPVRDGFI